jgi:lipopolysaccharide transport protein LptA
VRVLKASQIQSFLFLALLAFFVAHFVLLSPSGLEDDFNGVRIVNPKDLLNFLTNEPDSAFKAVPTDIVPSYSLRDSVVYSTSAEKPNWKMTSKKANVYQAQQLVHGLNVILELPDHSTVTADEAIFYTEKDEGEFHGHVHTVFRDGTTLDSQYAKVVTKPVTKIDIPLSQLATGEKISGKGSKQTSVIFHCYGLNYVDVDPQEIKLLSQVKVEVHSLENGIPKTTWVNSDQASYQNLKNYLLFFMSDSTPLAQQFVTARQIDLDLKSRTLEVNLDEHQKLDTLVAKGEVWMKDSRDETHISTATSGRAIFYDQKNEIHLYDYPQLYQDGDTVTGDVIVFNRDRDTIDVKESNAIYKR